MESRVNEINSYMTTPL